MAKSEIKKPLRLSASQLEQANSCTRAWWFNKVQKLPTVSDNKQIFGDVAHAVCERFLESKDLYPDGWEHPINRFTGEKEKESIAHHEQALVKALISKAIESGVLRREPDTQVEYEFRHNVPNDEYPIQLLGFIDHLHGNTIEDHKFTSAPQYYGITKLKQALPMILYAWVMYEQGEFNEPSCWLRYNVFVRKAEAPEVKQVIVELTKEEIYDYFEHYIRPIFKKMIGVVDVSEWAKVDSAMDNDTAATVCKKYGGCPFMDICLGKCTMESYKQRFLEDKKESQKAILESLLSGESDKQEEKGGSSMTGGFLSQLKNGGIPAPVVEKKEAQPVEAPAQPKPVEVKAEPAQPKPVEAPAPVAEAPVEAAPWAFEGCPACRAAGNKIKGVKNTGEPCNICVLMAANLREANPNQPVLEDYEIKVDAGKLTWTKKGEPAAQVQVAEEPSVAERLETKSGNTFDAPTPVEPVPLPEPVPVEEVKKRGRPRKLKGDDVPMSLLSEKKQNPVTVEDTPEIKPLKEIEKEEPMKLVPAPSQFKDMILSYAPIRIKQGAGIKDLTLPIIPIWEILEEVYEEIVEQAHKEGHAVVDAFCIDYFKRRDMISRLGYVIALRYSEHIIEASNVVASSDAHNLCVALEKYATCIIGSMRG